MLLVSSFLMAPGKAADSIVLYDQVRKAQVYRAVKHHIHTGTLECIILNNMFKFENVTHPGLADTNFLLLFNGREDILKKIGDITPLSILTFIILNEIVLASEIGGYA